MYYNDIKFNIQLFIKLVLVRLQCTVRYFRHAHFTSIVGVGKRGAYSLVHGDLPRQHSFGTTLRFTGPVPADLGSERYRYAIACPDKVGTDPLAYGSFFINKWTPSRNSGGIP